MKKYNIASGFAFVAGCLFVTVSVLYFMTIYLGNNPLNENLTLKQKCASIFPQGWSFFSKSAKEPLLYILKNEDNDVQLLDIRNASFANYMGLNRHNRILNVEISNILRQINKDTTFTLYTYRGSTINELKDTIIRSIVRYDTLSVRKALAPSVSGKYIFVFEFPRPWSLIHLKRDYKGTFKAYGLNIIPK